MTTKKKTKLTSIVLCMTLFISLLGTMSAATVYASETSLDIASKSILLMESGGNKTVNMQAYTGSVKITGTHTDHYIFVNTGEHSITLENVTMPRIMLTSNAKLNLTLVGNNIVDGSASKVPGIYVPNGAQLVITEESTGSLTVAGASGNAGIGGMSMDISGSITINGGTITATGGSGAAGIGCADTAETTSIIINGGTVTATGGSGAAAIGGGSGSNGTGIVISGGTVTATGGKGANAIGMGVDGTSQSVSVSPESGYKVVVKESVSDETALGEYTELTDITSVVDGNNTLYITSVEASVDGITSVEVTKDENTNTCTVKYSITAEDFVKTPTLYIAFYTDKNALVAVSVLDEDITYSDEITVAVPSGSKKCKVMLWQPTLAPLCVEDDCDI